MQYNPKVLINNVQHPDEKKNSCIYFSWFEIRGKNCAVTVTTIRVDLLTE